MGRGLVRECAWLGRADLQVRHDAQVCKLSKQQAYNTFDGNAAQRLGVMCAVLASVHLLRTSHEICVNLLHVHGQHRRAEEFIVFLKNLEEGCSNVPDRPLLGCCARQREWTAIERRAYAQQGGRVISVLPGGEPCITTCVVELNECVQIRVCL